MACKENNHSQNTNSEASCVVTLNGLKTVAFESSTIMVEIPLLLLSLIENKNDEKESY